MAGFVRRNTLITGTDVSRKKLFDHPEMADGTIFLWDPNHEYGEMVGVPGNGGVLPNVAGPWALPIIGGDAVLSDMQGVIATASEGPSMMQLERTSKGGIHIALSKVNMVTGLNNYQARLPVKIRQKIFDLIPQSSDDIHALYYSHWFKTTRAQGSMSNSVSWMHFATAVGISPSIYSTAGGTLAGGSILGSYSAVIDGESILAGANAGWSGTKPGALGQVSMLFGAGNADAWTFGGNKNAYPSRAYHRCKVELLHLNKRANNGAGGTLAEEWIAARDADIGFLTAALAAGGSLYGDIYTDPLTLCP